MTAVWCVQGGLTNEATESELWMCVSYGDKNESQWLLTCTANAVLPTPPSPRTMTLQESI